MSLRLTGVRTFSTASTVVTYTSFSYMMRSLRLEKGLSILQLAHKAKVSPITIRRIERGGYLPSVGTVFKLAEALGQDLKIDFLKIASQQ
jgi:transcriptional regulator with XRE-family HTH domain